MTQTNKHRRVSRTSCTTNHASTNPRYEKQSLPPPVETPMHHLFNAVTAAVAALDAPPLVRMYNLSYSQMHHSQRESHQKVQSIETSEEPLSLSLSLSRNSCRKKKWMVAPLPTPARRTPCLPLGKPTIGRARSRGDQRVPPRLVSRRPLAHRVEVCPARCFTPLIVPQ